MYLRHCKYRQSAIRARSRVRPRLLIQLMALRCLSSPPATQVQVHLIRITRIQTIARTLATTAITPTHNTRLSPSPSCTADTYPIPCPARSSAPMAPPQGGGGPGVGGSVIQVVHTDDVATKLGDRMKRRCFNCCTTDTSTRRRSNLSPGKVLCNKCGVFERTHSRPRPEQRGRAVPAQARSSGIEHAPLAVPPAGAADLPNPATLSPRPAPAPPPRTLPHPHMAPLTLPTALPPMVPPRLTGTRPAIQGCLIPKPPTPARRRLDLPAIMRRA
ncbi:GATA type zinc finger protein asd-4 [Mycena venus]|uniref:GATA type zinc finger protein asd-4 n=1 Tax=Mycena venus TaxID=2733690 RepID=A0A8H6Z856_9AGAR|nr:GATA type zinc finger protein asd-4 [Mycena venus]